MPRVSVITGSYNHEKFVEASLRSALEQSFDDIEIVVTDDGSSDGTVERIKSISDNRIKLFAFEKNRGACVSFKNSYDNSSGEYIAILNTDDEWLPGKLEMQVRFLDENPQTGAVFGKALVVDENDQPVSSKRAYGRVFDQTNRTRWEWLRFFFEQGNCLCHPTLLIRRECYEKVGFYDPRLAQLPDLDMWMRLCRIYEIHVMDQPLVKFRLRGANANASGNRPETLRRRCWEHRHILENYNSIPTFEELCRIFPNAAAYGSEVEADLVPFVVAMIAMKTESLREMGQLFALDTIYKLLQDNDKAGRIFERFGFSYSDFISMTGDKDPMNLSRVRELRGILRKSVSYRLGQKIARFAGRSDG